MNAAGPGKEDEIVLEVSMKKKGRVIEAKLETLGEEQFFRVKDQKYKNYLKANNAAYMHVSMALVFIVSIVFYA